MIATLLALPVAASAKEGKNKSLTLDQLPAKVAESIKKAIGESPAVIKAEKEDGIDAFEAKWEVKGKQHEITVSAEGAVIVEEEVIALEAAPEAVQAAIKKVPNKLIAIEKMTDKDGVKYEAAFKDNEGKLEVKFDAAGKEVARELEKKGGDDEADEKDGKDGAKAGKDDEDEDDEEEEKK